MTKKINLGIISLITFIIVFSNSSYGVFTPNIYQSDDKKILAYAELSAATVTLASGQRIHATNVNGDTQMKIDIITDPVELILVVDESGSMDGSRMESAKESARTLVENIFDVAENVKVSIIGFDDSARIRIEASSNKEDVLKAIDELVISGSTNMSTALVEAIKIFEKNKDEKTYSYLVNLTDGQTTQANKCYDLLSDMEKQNIKIYNILIELNERSAFSRDGKEIGTIYANISEEELIEIYDEIYGEICSEIISNSTDNFNQTGKNYFSTGDSIYMFLDQELLQGAKLQLEYIINIKAAFDCFKVELQGEIDDKLSFDESARMITEDQTNADYGWVINEDLTYKDGHNKVISLCKESDSPYVIKKGKKFEAKLYLSCLLTPKDDTNYANSILFRLNGEQELTQRLQSVEINIVPPFGENQNKNIIILLVVVLNIIVGILTIYIIHYKKRIK